MTTERLMFAAFDASQQSSELLAGIWGRTRAPRREPTVAEADQLAALARTLNCAALELQNRARGMRPAPLGHNTPA